MSDEPRTLIRAKEPNALELQEKRRRMKIKAILPAQLNTIKMLAQAGADNEQIAAYLGLNQKQFERALRSTRGIADRIPDWRKEGEAQILATIHWKAIEQKDMKALVWASKNRLGWSDKFEAAAKVEHQFIVETRPKLTPDQWDKTYRQGPTIEHDPIGDSATDA